MKYLFVVFLLILIPVNAYGFSMVAGHPEQELSPGESATYQWQLNSNLDEPATVYLSAMRDGKELLSFEREVVLPPNQYVSIPITTSIPDDYPTGYYEPQMIALLTGYDSNGGITINSALAKYIKITVIPNESQYRLDLQVGKGDTIRNVLGDVIFVSDILSDFTVTIYNEKGELTFSGTASTNTNSEDEMIQNGITILVEPITDGIAHEREFEMIFTPTENSSVFDVSGTIYTPNLENGTIYRTVPIQSGTLTLID